MSEQSAAAESRAHGPLSTLRGRVFLATLAASLTAVGLALAIGIVTTRQAVRDSYTEEVKREAEVLATRTAIVADSFGVDDELISREQAPDDVRGLLGPPGAYGVEGGGPSA
ncbi:MAG: hypothetical protein HZB14_04140 [Actinobacteria bacterium]|nr:hypothetical protein [Actinomycetota bacterium]